MNLLWELDLKECEILLYSNYGTLTRSSWSPYQTKPSNLLSAGRPSRTVPTDANQRTCDLSAPRFIKFNLLVDYFFKKKIFISFERMLIVIIKVLFFICFLVIAFWISYTFNVSTLSENCFADTQLSSTQRNKYQPMREQNWNKMTNLKPENWTHYHLFFRHLTWSRNNPSTHF